MFSMTKCVAAAAFGAGRADGALLAVPVVPAAALADGVAEVGRAVAKGVRWLRQTAALVLREAAEVLDPSPVARLRVYPVAGVAPPPPVAMPVKAPAPVLVIASAAQVTAEAEGPAPVDLAAVLAEHGSVRAAARAVGVAESTFRGRCRKAGVQLPGRRAKG